MITYIGIGSNLGDRRENIRKAILLLEEVNGVKIVRTSSIYETNPVGDLSQGKYLNGVIEVDTTMNPYKFLKELNIIEKLLGRERKVLNSPRTIDLDILTYGNLRICDRILTIPHPRMHEREFVLKGLKELEHKEGAA